MTEGQKPQPVRFDPAVDSIGVLWLNIGWSRSAGAPGFQRVVHESKVGAGCGFVPNPNPVGKAWRRRTAKFNSVQP